MHEYEYVTDVEIPSTGHTYRVSVDKVNGGTVGEAHPGSWRITVTDVKSARTVFDYAPFKTAQPESHHNVAVTAAFLADRES